MNDFKIKAVMIGHAIGDALGVPVEFCTREDLDENPVTDMQGNGTYPVPKGAWSDDTSMSLCALDVLKEDMLDYDRIMINFGRWYYKDEFTPTGEMFDVGNACSMAIDNYFANKKSYTECGLDKGTANGNGSLMRIHPFVLYLADKDMALEKKIEIIHTASALTHAHERSKVACGIYAFVLWELLENPSRRSVMKGLRTADKYYRRNSNEYETYRNMLFRRIAGLYRHFENYDTFHLATRDEIKSSGYVVDTLEAAIWCLLNTYSYEECVLKAVNLGDDTDTVAAVAGGLAGALYGYEKIPNKWKKELLKIDYIEEMCEKASEIWACKIDFPIVDLHMHVVPIVDDGSTGLGMSIDMIKLAYEQGVRHIFCTSHNGYSDEDVIKYHIEFKMTEASAKAYFPELKLYKGCELLCSDSYIDDIMHGINSKIFLPLGETKYILTELYSDATIEEALNVVERMVKEGYKPIIAHIERCVYLTENDTMSKIIDKGALIQINAYSLFEETDEKIKSRARKLLENRQIHFIGSDAHKTDHRPPNVKSGIKYILQKAGVEYTKDVCYRNAVKCGLIEL